MQRLRRGDDVMVVRGNHKGKRGKVRRVLPERDAVVVEGVNRKKRHVKSQAGRAGGILEVEAPIAACKVMPIDPKTGKPTRVRYQIVDGQKERVAQSGAKLTAEE